MALALAAMLLNSIQTYRYRVDFQQDHFVITSTATKKLVGDVSIVSTPPKQSYGVGFSAGHVKMTWDQRGLTIKSIGKPYRTEFRDVPTSPRLRPRKDIRLTLVQAHTQGRKLTASALSGWQEQGSDVYLLVRWQDKPGYAWLEALERIDLGQSIPRPETLAILPGVSFSAKAVDSNLLRIGQDLVAYVHSGTTWGRWSFNTATQKSSYLKLGENPKYINGLKNGEVQAIEKTPYGSFNASLLNGISGVRLCHEEFERMPKFVNPLLAGVVEVGTEKKELVNIETGATKTVPSDSQYAVVKGDLLLWTGGDQPQRAWFLSPAEWSPFGEWSQS